MGGPCIYLAPFWRYRHYDKRKRGKRKGKGKWRRGREREGGRKIA